MFLLMAWKISLSSVALSRTASKSKHNKNSLEDMAILLQGKQAILADQALSDEVKKAFQFGSSLGGARPKTTVMEDKISYLAKFNRTDDLFNVCRVEHACMKMLSELTDLNVRVANTRLLNNHDEDILLVERFDCLESRSTHHLLSANSLINQMKVTEQSSTTFYSYGALAEFNMKYGAEPIDSHELFARMIFNICMGNTDDHSRNHAFLYSFKNKHWRLSKAYDVLPINNTRQHGIGIGAQGRLGSIDNAMSQAKRFGLNSRKAKAIANMVVELTSEWAFYFGNNGVSELDIEVLKAVVPDSSRP